MNIESEILINQYGQDIIHINFLRLIFKDLDLAKKRSFLKEIIYHFIQQSKAKDEDILDAIEMSNLKPTYTPCVMIKKVLTTSNLEKIVELPEKELEKVFILFLSVFKIAYQRRFLIEKNTPEKWWYWDMSDENNIAKIKKQYKD